MNETPYPCEIRDLDLGADEDLSPVGCDAESTDIYQSFGTAQSFHLQGKVVQREWDFCTIVFLNMAKCGFIWTSLMKIVQCYFITLFAPIK